VTDLPAQAERDALHRRVERLEAALGLMVEAFDRHALWCGYKEDAPGDPIHAIATDAARAALNDNQEAE
jgi:hypothetical protein